MKKRVGISIGDPNGIGLEVGLKAVSEVGNLKSEAGCDAVFIGDPDLIAGRAKQLGVPVPEILESSVRFPQAVYGECSAEAGIASSTWVEEGIQGCLKGELDALVTAPINKQAWDFAGVGFPGHTELLAARCGTDRFGMLLAGKGLRVILATRHVPISKVPEVLNEREIRLAVSLLCEGLPLFGVDAPRIGICGLNPHAGDGGSIGKEEVNWITPLIEQMKAEGLPVMGPRPADTVFHEAVHGAYDAVVALYHDQGLGPLKLWAFDEGVNITLGLPIIRTSPDHGTAFGIARQGIARPDSMIEALKAAMQLCTRENPWKTSFPA
ncbi:4-hydroxythreonine-4-phosphate dehydrogenase PdxA [Kiritimatiellaeota bacterium B1221]|nr:4-hydroxythreonine-4-phosphate dehydrogenase PdxA [Kiritimatiellaeota bacterium B1221]